MKLALHSLTLPGKPPNGANFRSVITRFDDIFCQIRVNCLAINSYYKPYLSRLLTTSLIRKCLHNQVTKARAVCRYLFRAGIIFWYLVRFRTNSREIRV